MVCLYTLSKNLSFAKLSLTNHGVSRYMGVARKGNKWGASITAGGRQFFFGAWPTKDQAARAYDEARIFLVIFTIVHVIGGFVKDAVWHSLDRMRLLYQVLCRYGSRLLDMLLGTTGTTALLRSELV